MANKNKYLNEDGVSHFYLLIKQKLTTLFKSIFVEQRTGYDLSKNDFTDALKTKLENLSDNGNVVAEEEIIVITVSANTETGEITVEDEAIDIILNYDGEKPMYLKVEPFDCYFAYEQDNIFGGYYSGEFYRFEIDTNSRKVTINELGELLSSDVIIDNFDGTTAELQQSIPSRSAVLSYINDKTPILDNSGKIPSSYLPSYVDDVVEGYYGTDGDSKGKFWDEHCETNGGKGTEIPGEESKIYLDLNTNKTYRWGGSVYIELESSAGISPLSNKEIEDIINSVDGVV